MILHFSILVMVSVLLPHAGRLTLILLRLGDEAWQSRRQAKKLLAQQEGQA